MSHLRCYICQVESTTSSINIYSVGLFSVCNASLVVLFSEGRLAHQPSFISNATSSRDCAPCAADSGPPAMLLLPTRGPLFPDHPRSLLKRLFIPRLSRVLSPRISVYLEMDKRLRLESFSQDLAHVLDQFPASDPSARRQRRHISPRVLSGFIDRRVPWSSSSCLRPKLASYLLIITVATK